MSGIKEGNLNHSIWVSVVTAHGEGGENVGHAGGVCARTAVTHPLPVGVDKGFPLDPPGGRAERLFLLFPHGQLSRATLTAKAQ